MATKSWSGPILRESMPIPVKTGSGEPEIRDPPLAASTSAMVHG
jgi:hypothetical protein